MQAFHAMNIKNSLKESDTRIKFCLNKSQCDK